MAHIRVLGGSTWFPTKSNDSASYIIGNHMIVDLGWDAPARMLMAGEDLQQYDTVLFTHMHADHMLGLPQLIMDWRVKSTLRGGSAGGSLEGLTVAGPCETLRENYNRANMFALEGAVDKGVDAPARLIELKPYGGFETDELIVRAIPSKHAVPGRCYRITDKASGHSVGLSGDTAWQEEFAEFFRDVDLLVYEAAFGTERISSENNSVCRHSSVYEAARVANDSHARALMLTHHELKDEQACLALARTLTDVPLYWARTGLELEF